MCRSRCTGRLLISAASSRSARMKPWTGSRSESSGGDCLVAVVLAGQMPEGPQQVEHPPSGAQYPQQVGRALRQALDQQLQLAARRQVELGRQPIDQLLQLHAGQLGDRLLVERKTLAHLAGDGRGELQEVAAQRR